MTFVQNIVSIMLFICFFCKGEYGDMVNIQLKFGIYGQNIEHFLGADTQLVCE